MTVPLGFRRATAGSFSIVRISWTNGAPHVRAHIQTKDQANGNEGSLNPIVARMRRKFDLAARASVLMREPEQRLS